MDNDAELKKLEDERDFILSWLEHPLTRKVYGDNSDEQEAVINLITLNDIESLGAFFAHHQAVGHLRGLRRGASIVKDDLEEVSSKIKELKG